MNPRVLKNFATSKFGLFVLFVTVLFSGILIYGRGQSADRQAGATAGPGGSKVELGQVRLPLDKGLESGIPQQAGTTVAAQTAAPGDGRIVPFRPATGGLAETKSGPNEAPRKASYRSLLTNYEVAAADSGETDRTPPARFMPYGTLLKCKLVNTVDSTNLATPVIALLLEDVWQNGKLVVPANTLVHGTARAGRMRDRVDASGTWRFVWQDGRELAFNGVALDREYDQDIAGYGITDGSAGLRGRVIATDDLQELKVLAAAALSGFARGTQDRSQTALGTTITGSVSNGVREGVGDVFELYASRTLREVEQNGYFVRVAAGKEFYVYVLGTVNPDKATVGGAKVEPPASPANAIGLQTDPKSKG